MADNRLCEIFNPMRKLIIIFLILLSVPEIRAQEKKLLSFYDDNYAITGYSPVQNKFDIKFQLSLKVYPITLSPNWEGFFAYTQTATWDAYQWSSPFHDIIFQPGVYFQGDYGRNVITLALEHQSNGRPIWGTPMRNSETDIDDYSRGMNYLKVVWTRNLNEKMQTKLTLKGGMATGIGDYKRYNIQWAQDLYMYYLGYLTAEYIYDDGRWNFRLALSPLFNKWLTNATIEAGWRPKDNWPSLFVQAHYGFDETLTDCYPDSKPRMHIRAGLKLNFRKS